CGPKGELDEVYNPNGSVENIAGIASPDFRVMGMMPHPERACEELLGSVDGRKIFLSIVAWLEERKYASCGS
ncbi:MAG: phosphoribosylformylglycinamidine synthase subunit PurQ, partial [Atribacterota bacterium]